MATRPCFVSAALNQALRPVRAELAQARGVPEAERRRPALGALSRVVGRAAGGATSAPATLASATSRYIEAHTCGGVGGRGPWRAARTAAALLGGCDGRARRAVALRPC